MRRFPDLGQVMQMAYVPDDFQAALQFWTGVMGVGPFYLQPRLSPAGMRYMGKPTDAVFTIAIAYWGDMQIELIEQHNDAPSIFSRQPDNRRGGLHHVCILVDDIEAARRTAIAGGGVIAQEIPGDGWGVIYVETGDPGGLLEIIQPNAGMQDRFARMRTAAGTWDGTDPLRTFA